MQKNCYSIFGLAAALILLAGCGDSKVGTDPKQDAAGQETEMGLEEFFLSAEEAGDVAIVTEEYSEETPYPELADFLISYYGIPEEYQSETRYYYNFVDLNEDGINEIFAVVIGEYTEVSFGDPAVILSEEEGGTFGVIESFEGVHTPITISDQLTNGWHDITYNEYGIGAENGYRICRYNPEGGYQTGISEVVDELEPVGGTQILSNNLIDDMDQGRYLTLAPQEEE